MKIIILGSGPCGLGAAYHLHKLGYSNWQLFERDDHVGGLSASFVDTAGFTWDMGGHVLFSHFLLWQDMVSFSVKVVRPLQTGQRMEINKLDIKFHFQ